VTSNESTRDNPFTEFSPWLGDLLVPDEYNHSPIILGLINNLHFQSLLPNTAPQVGQTAASQCKRHANATLGDRITVGKGKQRKISSPHQTPKLCTSGITVLGEIEREEYYATSDIHDCQEKTDILSPRAWVSSPDSCPKPILGDFIHVSPVQTKKKVKKRKPSNIPTSSKRDTVQSHSAADKHLTLEKDNPQKVSSTIRKTQDLSASPCSERDQCLSELIECHYTSPELTANQNTVKEKEVCKVCSRLFHQSDTSFVKERCMSRGL
jgi:hypothetical protein